ncbi:agmatine deiminase family protein, partial [Zoogloea sp.]|uniref:agmatine deiminase family protein n=1 Tax=Zoogloea sp. TaxID=49181 RepID=UPI0025D09D45
VEVWDIPTDDLWCRDSGPTFVKGADGALAVSLIQFNGWGGKQAHDNDARIARRAAEMAVFARQTDLASDASRLWLELDPTSLQAQQLASGAAASSARIEELETHLASALARLGDKVGPALLGLNRGLARIPDKALIRRLVNDLTQPYLDQPEAHFARANAAYTAGDPAGAAQALEGALRLR